jgi:hypothetical protein
MPISPELKSLFRDTFNVVVLSVGLVSGIGQLLQFSKGLGRLVLQLIAVACVLFLLIRVWFVYFVARNRQLRKRLEELNDQLTLQQAGHQHYLDAIERVSDRENPYFDETLEVTVTIGANDEGDAIIERRLTNPQPRVTHLTMRPIVPDEERVARLEEISFKAELTGVAGSITDLPLRERIRFLRVWLVFDPAMTGPTEWEVRYHPKGLWRPLRERGYDVLKWDDRLPRADGAPSALTDFTVRFVFPESSRPPSVIERNGWGVCKDPQKINGSGGWEVVWRDDHPVGRRYVWDLAQPTEGNGN